MENAQKWAAFVSGYIPQAMCIIVLLAAVHAAYWHIDLSKEFFSVVGAAAGFLLRTPK